MVSLTTFMKKPPTFKIFLLNMAKLGAARGFYMVYLYTCELYPTDIRTTAVGCSSVCARYDISWASHSLVVTSFNPLLLTWEHTWKLRLVRLCWVHIASYLCVALQPAVSMHAGWQGIHDTTKTVKVLTQQVFSNDIQCAKLTKLSGHRVGAIIGFLMSALSRYWEPLPLVMY